MVEATDIAAGDLLITLSGQLFTEAPQSFSAAIQAAAKKRLLICIMPVQQTMVPWQHFIPALSARKNTLFPSPDVRAAPNRRRPSILIEQPDVRMRSTARRVTPTPQTTWLVALRSGNGNQNPLAWAPNRPFSASFFCGNAMDGWTWMHLELEVLLNGHKLSTISEVRLLLQFLSQWKHPASAYRTEWTVFPTEEKLAGPIDFVTQEPDSLNVSDWKRTKSVH